MYIFSASSFKKSSTIEWRHIWEDGSGAKTEAKDGWSKVRKWASPQSYNCSYICLKLPGATLHNSIAAYTVTHSLTNLGTILVLATFSTLRIYCHGIAWSGAIQLHFLKQRILSPLPIAFASPQLYMVTVLTTLIPTTFYHCISDKDNLVAICLTPNCRLVTWSTLKLQSPTPGLPAHSYFPLESNIFIFCQWQKSFTHSPLKTTGG